MKNLLKILSNTRLLKNENTTKVLSKAVRNAFDETNDREEAETLVLLAYKYKLPCLERMLTDLDCIPKLPF